MVRSIIIYFFCFLDPNFISSYVLDNSNYTYFFFTEIGIEIPRRQVILAVLETFLPAWAEAYSEPTQNCQTTKMEFFAKIVNGFQPLTIFAKSFILNVCQDFQYTSGGPKDYPKLLCGWFSY